jgi:DNA polymerase-3 subunit beta
MDIMKITNKELKEILKRVEKSITIQDKNAIDDVFNSLEINSQNDTIEVIATNVDNNSQIVLDTGLKAECKGNIFLNKKDITKIKKLKTDFVFDFENKVLNSGNFKINLLKNYNESFDFEVFNVVDTPIILSDKIKDNISNIINVADINNPKFELNGILIENVSNDLNIVSTDTRRLTILNDTLDFGDFTINPNKKALELVNWNDVNFMLLSEKHLIIKEKNITHNIGLIVGKFPEYKRIVPSGYNKTVKIASCQFKNALKECSVFGADMTINQNLSFDILSKDGFDIEATYKHSFDFKDINISFMIKYVLEAINSETIEFCFNENNIPFTIIGDGYKTVIMPIVKTS